MIGNPRPAAMAAFLAQAKTELAERIAAETAAGTPHFDSTAAISDPVADPLHARHAPGRMVAGAEEWPAGPMLLSARIAAAAIPAIASPATSRKPSAARTATISAVLKELR